MVNLKALQEKREDLLAEMTALTAKADEETRAMNDDEIARFDELEKTVKAIDVTIETENRAKALELTKNENKKSEVEKMENINVLEERAFDDYLRDVVSNKAEERADAYMTQGNNGSIVPKSIADRIIKAVKDRVDFLKYANVVFCAGTYSVPVYTDTNEANYIAETIPQDATTGTFSTIDLTGYVIMATAVVSKKMINNTTFDLVGFVVEETAEKIANKLEKEFINGTSGKISGVLATTNTVTATSATAITYDELVTLKHSRKQIFQKNGVWLMAPATYTAICKLKNNNGQPYFGDDDYMILNCPVLVSDNMPTLATGNKSIIFGDLGGYTVKMSTTVETELKREKYNYAIGVEAAIEVDGKITDAQRLCALVQA